MNDLRETVLDTAPYSFLLLGATAAALILGAVACLLGHRRRRWRGLPGHLALAAGSVVLLVLGCGVAAGHAWRSVVIRELLQSTRPADGDVNAAMVNLGIRVEFAMLVFIGALTLLALAMVALGLTLSWRTEAMRGQQSPAASRLTTIALLLPICPVAAGVLLYGLRMNGGFMAVAATAPSMKTVELLQSIDGAQSILEPARVALLLLVALGSIATVVSWGRGALRPVSSVHLAASALLFLAGLFAFTATRGHAADRRPLPILPHATDASYASKVPSMSPCPPTESAPTLEFASDFVRLDWSHVNPDDFQAHFETARNNYRLLHDGRPMPFLILVADRATPTARIVPYLQKVPDGTAVLVASATSHPVLSKTLGTIPRYEFCGRTFNLTYRETATHLSRYGSWSDVAAAVSGDSNSLQLAPW
jgi:hypothetical protein